MSVYVVHLLRTFLCCSRDLAEAEVVTVIGSFAVPRESMMTAASPRDSPRVRECCHVCLSSVRGPPEKKPGRLYSILARFSLSAFGRPYREFCLVFTARALAASKLLISSPYFTSPQPISVCQIIFVRNQAISRF